MKKIILFISLVLNLLVGSSGNTNIFQQSFHQGRKVLPSKVPLHDTDSSYHYAEYLKKYTNAKSRHQRYLKADSAADDNYLTHDELPITLSNVLLPPIAASSSFKNYQKNYKTFKTNEITVPRTTESKENLENHQFKRSKDFTNHQKSKLVSTSSNVAALVGGPGLGYLPPHEHKQFLRADKEVSGHRQLIETTTPKFQIIVPDTEAPVSQSQYPETPVTLTENSLLNPNPFDFNNQIFHQNTPSQVDVNIFLKNPFDSLPNSKDSKELITTKTTYISRTQHRPPPAPALPVYSNDFYNRIYPQIAAYTNPKLIQMLKFNPEISNKKFTADFHTFEEPQEPEDEEIVRTITPPRQHYRIIFIKVADQFKRNLLKIAKAQHTQTEQKTVIYVLTKKPDPIEIQETLNSIPPRPVNKPQVHFIKYKTNEDAILAQQNIQAQYDQIQGDTVISNEGTAPVLSITAAKPAKMSTVLDQLANREYLPPKIT